MKRAGQAEMMSALMGPHRRPGRERAETPRVVEGRILDVTAEGAFFIVPSWDEGKFRFGPSPWNMAAVEPTTVGPYGAHDHAATEPPAGSLCLAVFYQRADGSTGSWILGWWTA